MSAFRDLILESELTYFLLRDRLQLKDWQALEKIEKIVRGESSESEAGAKLEQVRAVLAELNERDNAREALDAFRDGRDEATVYDAIEQEKDSENIEKTIEALGSYDEEFDILICSAGPLYFVRANEFDDMEWFGGCDDAKAFAEGEFESFITALSEREEEDEEGY